MHMSHSTLSPLDSSLRSQVADKALEPGQEERAQDTQNQTQSAKRACAVFKQLSFRYPGANALALDQLTLQIQAGETLALLGPNGAGKSTAIKLLLGLLPLQTGQVQILGQAPQLASARAQLGVVLQHAGLPDKLTVREQLRLQASYFTDPADINTLLADLSLVPLADRRLSALSGGERRRLEFALALVGRPKLIVLDEPTVGIDMHERAKILELLAQLKARGMALLLTTHLLDEAERLADRIAYIEAGQLRFVGTMNELRERAKFTEMQIQTTLPTSWLQAQGAIVLQHVEQTISLKTEQATVLLRKVLSEDSSCMVLSVRPARLEDALRLVA